MPAEAPVAHRLRPGGREPQPQPGSAEPRNGAAGSLTTERRFQRPTSPVISLLEGTQPAGERFSHIQSMVESAQLPKGVSEIVVKTGLAGATQSREVIDRVATGLDAQADHPALRDHVAEHGTIQDITDQPRTTFLTRDSRDSFLGATDTAVRVETAVRASRLLVAEQLNSLNGSGPHGVDRVEAEHTAAELTGVVVRQAMETHALHEGLQATTEPQPVFVADTKATDVTPFPEYTDEVTFARQMRDVGSDRAAVAPGLDQKYTDAARRVNPNPSIK